MHFPKTLCVVTLTLLNSKNSNLQIRKIMYIVHSYFEWITFFITPQHQEVAIWSFLQTFTVFQQCFKLWKWYCMWFNIHLPLDIAYAKREAFKMECYSWIPCPIKFYMAQVMHLWHALCAWASCLNNVWIYGCNKLVKRWEMIWPDIAHKGHVDMKIQMSWNWQYTLLNIYVCLDHVALMTWGKPSHIF